MWCEFVVCAVMRHHAAAYRAIATRLCIGTGRGRSTVSDEPAATEGVVSGTTIGRPALPEVITVPHSIPARTGARPKDPGVEWTREETDAIILEFEMDLIDKCKFHSETEMRQYYRLKPEQTVKRDNAIAIDIPAVSDALKPTLVPTLPIEMIPITVHHVQTDTMAPVVLDVVQAEEEHIRVNSPKYVIKRPTRVQTALNRVLWGRTIVVFDVNTMGQIRLGIATEDNDSGQRKNILDAARAANQVIHGMDDLEDRTRRDTMFHYTTCELPNTDRDSWMRTMDERLDQDDWPGPPHQGIDQSRDRAEIQRVQDGIERDPHHARVYPDDVRAKAARDIYDMTTRRLADNSAAGSRKNSVMMVRFERGEARVGTRHRYNVEDLDDGNEAVYTYADSDHIGDPQTIVGWDLVAIMCSQKFSNHYTCLVRDFYTEGDNVMKPSWLYINDTSPGFGNPLDSNMSEVANGDIVPVSRVARVDMSGAKPLLACRERNEIVATTAVYVRRERPNQPSSLLRVGGERFVPRVGVPDDVEHNNGKNLCYQTALLVAMARCGIVYAPLLLRWNQMRQYMLWSCRQHHDVRAGGDLYNFKDPREYIDGIIKHVDDVKASDPPRYTGVWQRIVARGVANDPHNWDEYRKGIRKVDHVFGRTFAIEIETMKSFVVGTRSLVRRKPGRTMSPDEEEEIALAAERARRREEVDALKKDMSDELFATELSLGVDPELARQRAAEKFPAAWEAHVEAVRALPKPRWTGPAHNSGWGWQFHRGLLRWRPVNLAEAAAAAAAAKKKKR